MLLLEGGEGLLELPFPPRFVRCLHLELTLHLLQAQGVVGSFRQDRHLGRFRVFLQFRNQFSELLEGEPVRKREATSSVRLVDVRRFSAHKRACRPAAFSTACPVPPHGATPT